jgi:hypothetical protein
MSDGLTLPALVPEHPSPGPVPLHRYPHFPHLCLRHICHLHLPANCIIPLQHLFAAVAAPCQDQCICAVVFAVVTALLSQLWSASRLCLYSSLPYITLLVCFCSSAVAMPQYLLFVCIAVLLLQLPKPELPCPALLSMLSCS